MTTPDYIKAILATLMWREDSGDGLQGMVAVGCVVRNRVLAGWNGGDWLAVMTAHNQFSSMVIVGDPNTVRYPDPRDAKFQSLLWDVEKIYDGSVEDITGGALYYANLNIANSPWFFENIVQKPDAHPRTGTVGQQTFFK